MCSVPWNWVCVWRFLRDSLNLCWTEEVEQDFEAFLQRYLSFLRKQEPDYGLPVATEVESRGSASAAGGSSESEKCLEA